MYIYFVGSCADTIANCASYTKATCTDPNYAKWVTDHCAKYCNKCGEYIKE